MIEFYLNEMQVYPAEGQTITFRDYNTLCEASNGKGAYTYDIDFDLNVKANASAFNWLRKLNTENIPTGRKAVMYVDGVKIFEGTESLLSVVGMTAKIQVLCGNSEVNFRGNDTRIADLALPVIPEYTAEQAKQTWFKDLATGSEHVIFVPVLTKLDKFPYNEDDEKFANFIDKDTIWNSGGPNFVDGTPLIPQPSLVWAIECVVQAIGFELKLNVLRTLPYAKNMVIIHGYSDRHLNRILPNWTVSEFLSEVQKLFNVVFVFREDHTAYIYKVGEFYKNQAGVKRLNYSEIVDRRSTFERNFDRKEEYLFNYDKIAYDMPSSYFYNRACLDEDVRKLCAVQNVSGFTNLKASSILSEANYNKPNIYRETASGSQWIISKESPMATTLYHMERVEQFAKFVNSSADENTTETLLKIVPAEIFCLDIHPLNSNGRYYNMGAGVAYARNKDDKEDLYDETKGLNEWIDEEPPKEVSTSDNKLFVAQVDGNAHVLWEHEGTSTNLDIYNGASYPQTYVSRYIDGIVHAAGTTRYAQIFDFGAYDSTKVNAECMDLAMRASDIYNKAAVVDEDEVFVVKFLCKKRIEVNDIFMIDNKQFLCVSNEYTIEKGHVSPFVLGTFLRLTGSFDLTDKEIESVSKSVRVIPASYQVGANPPKPMWKKYDGVVPDISSRFDFYQSTNAGLARSTFWLKVVWKGVPNFVIGIVSDAERFYDYVVAYEMDKNVEPLMDAAIDKDTVGVISDTYDWQRDPTILGNYKEVKYTNDGEEHFCWVAFRKDTSNDVGSDSGYVLIPKV